MDFSIPPELEQMKEVVRKFVARELAPLEQSVDALDHIEPDKMRELRQKAVKIGIYGYNLPVEIGGGGLSALGDVLISEDTFELTKHVIDGRPVREITVKGRAKAVMTYEVLGLKNEPHDREALDSGRS